jgi:hypothetical protein
VIRLPERERGFCWGSYGSSGKSGIRPTAANAVPTRRPADWWRRSAVRIGEGMPSYAEMARERKKARSLYLELRALELDLYAKEDPHDATGYRVRMAGLHSLP